jgi:hypothetical protein
LLITNPLFSHLSNLAFTSGSVLEVVSAGSLTEGEKRVGGVRALTDSYAREERSEDLDREKVELRRRERRVGVDTDREWSGVRVGFGARLGRRRESGIFDISSE